MNVGQGAIQSLGLRFTENLTNHLQWVWSFDFKRLATRLYFSLSCRRGVVAKRTRAGLSFHQCIHHESTREIEEEAEGEKKTTLACLCE